jgi:hypothetical protein
LPKGIAEKKCEFVLRLSCDSSPLACGMWQGRDGESTLSALSRGLLSHAKMCLALMKPLSESSVVLGRGGDMGERWLSSGSSQKGVLFPHGSRSGSASLWHLQEECLPLCALLSLSLLVCCFRCGKWTDATTCLRAASVSQQSSDFQILTQDEGQRPLEV